MPSNSETRRPRSLPVLSGTAGDPLTRLDELVRRDKRALVSVARSEGLDAEEALECVQDALLTFVSKHDEEMTPERTTATAMTMVRNAARNFRRRHRRAKRHVPVDEAAVPAAFDPAADSALAHAEDVVRLRACVAELCSVQRAVVMLRLLDEQSGEDVAVTLGLTRGHVDVLVHRAKAALRVCMREDGAHVPNGDARPKDRSR